MRFLTMMFLLILAVPAWSVPMDHVILVSVDGLRADLLHDLLLDDPADDYANFQRLVDEGVSTFNARTDYTHTVTVPNHVTMITGRPVLQPVGQPDMVHHGYTSNTDPEPEDTLHNMGNPALSYVAGVFDIAHDHGLSTALYASKSKFILFDQSFDGTNGAPDVTGPDDGRDKIDTYYSASSGSPANAAVMQTAFRSHLAGDPADFCFVHYRDPDSAGHAAGWGSAVWNDAVKDVDDYIGEILGFIDANPGLMGRTIVIVTADHGGANQSHSDPTDWRDYTIPYFVWGTEVAVGEDLYALNPANRLDPGGGRPDYNVAVAPIRNGGSGNLALDLLGLPPIAGSTINAAQDLAVADPAATVPGSSGLPIVALEAYPNPFNARAVLDYELARGGNVRFTVWDVAGRRVRELEAGHRAQGRHQVVWDGRDGAGHSMASGVYFFRLETEGARQTRRLVLVQ